MNITAQASNRSLSASGKKRFPGTSGKSFLVGGAWCVALLASVFPSFVHGAEDVDVLAQHIVADLIQEVTPAIRGLVLDDLKRLSANGAWPDINYAHKSGTGWSPLEHPNRLLTMAQVWRADGGKDDALLAGILSGMDYWLAKDPKSPNWWHNEIGVPRNWGPLMLLMEERLSPAQKEGGRKIMARAGIRMTGQNRIWLAINTLYGALLARDAALVQRCVDEITRTIAVTTAEGVQPDWSYHQHGSQLYTHGYGASFVSDSTHWAVLAQGTPVAFAPEKIAILESLVLDGSQWLARGALTGMAGSGRCITRGPEISAGYLAGGARNLLLLKTPRAAELQALQARVTGEPGAAPLVGHRHFWCSDTSAHHRPAFYAELKMSSKRTLGTEAGNGEGLKNRHMGEGVLLVYRDGEPYGPLLPVWNWRQLPGTTIIQETGALPEVSWGKGAEGTTTFVGGVSDGQAGIACYDFAKHGLTARKAWFFFDDLILCLGAGITATNANDTVVTTLDQRPLTGPVQWSDGKRQVTLANGEHALEGARAVVQSNLAWLFPEATAVTVRAGPQSGSWYAINHVHENKPVSADVLAILIDHGRKPLNAGYAYVIAPDVKATGVDLDRLGARIAVNTPAVQAAVYERAELAGAVFYAAGEAAFPAGVLRVSRPCIVMLRTAGGTVAASVANPNNGALAVTVEWLPKDGQARQASFALPGGTQAGSTVTQELRKP
jgi:chondroitin AC lyase